MYTSLISTNFHTDHVHYFRVFRLLSIGSAKHKKEPSVNLVQEDVDDLAEFDEKVRLPKQYT